MEKIRQSEKGITLIALVVTVIVLLILAGVTIAIVVKDNGIIEKSNLAKKETASSQKREGNDLSYADKIIEGTVDDREIPIVLVMTPDKNDKVDLPIKEDCLVDWDYQWENNPNYEGNFVNEEVKNDRRISHYYNNGPIKKHTIAIKGDISRLSNYNGLSESKVNEVLSWGTTGLKIIDLSYNETLTKIADPNINSFEKLEDCYGMFMGCSSLEKIPANFLVDCPNLTNMQSAFFGCDSLTELPERVIVNCPKLTTLKQAFRECKKIVEVSEELIIDCPNIKEIDGIFLDCKSLAVIPGDLFANCYNVSCFDYCFENCNSLVTIPDDLFANCTKATSFFCIFKNCTSLTAIPEKLFDNCLNVEHFTVAFANDINIKGNCPELWNRVNADGTKPTGSGCFNYCEKSSNYSIIPEPWKNFVEPR